MTPWWSRSPTGTTGPRRGRSPPQCAAPPRSTATCRPGPPHNSITRSPSARNLTEPVPVGSITIAPRPEVPLVGASDFFIPGRRPLPRNEEITDDHRRPAHARRPAGTVVRADRAGAHDRMEAVQVRARDGADVPRVRGAELPGRVRTRRRHPGAGRPGEGRPAAGDDPAVPVRL